MHSQGDEGEERSGFVQRQELSINNKKCLLQLVCKYQINTGKTVAFAQDKEPALGRTLNTDKKLKEEKLHKGG